MASRVVLIVKTLFAILAFTRSICNYSFAQTFANVSVMVTNHLASSETPAAITVYKSESQEITIHKAELRGGNVARKQFLNFSGSDRTNEISSNNASATLNLDGSEQSQVGVYTVTVRQDQEEIEMRILILNRNASVTPREYSTVVSIGESVSLFTNRLRGIQESSLRWRKDGAFQDAPCNKMGSCREENAQKSTLLECFEAGTYGKQKHAIMNLIVRGCPDGKWGPDCEETCPRCLNGGICSHVTGVCQCPPGFSGINCEKVHGRNVFGQSGEHKCNETGDDNSDGCKGALICYPNPFGCVCPASYSGLDCTEECEDGKFGANCKQTCHCRENVTCAKDTGVCGDNQCGDRWKGTNCQALNEVQNLKVMGQNIPGQLNASWDSPDISQNSCPSDSYTVKYRFVGYRECNESADISGGVEKVETTSNPFYVLRNLKANANYEVKVRANGCINSQERAQTGQTAETAPTAAPRNVKVCRINSTSSRFVWERPGCESSNGFITKYYYRLEHNETSFKEEYHGSRAIYIDGLTPYTEYSFYVLALTSVGPGPFSEPLVYTTAEDIPPKLLRPVSPFANTSVIEVNWKSPNPPHGIIRNYEISYRRSNESAQVTNVTAEAAGEPPIHILTGLDAIVNYMVKVRAYTSVGPGPYSEPLEQITKEGLPGAPINLTVSRRALYNLTIEWDIPYKPKGKITKYELQYQAIVKPYDKYFSVDVPMTLIMEYPKESYEINDLDPSTIYEIHVSAYNGAGQGESASINGTTALFKELQAVNVNHVTTTRKETTAEIILPALTQKYATGYRIRIRSLQNKKKRTVSTLRSYEENPDDYITAELDKNDKERPFTVGDGNSYGGYFNAPLEKDEKYEMFVHTLSKVGEEVEEVSSEPIPLYDDGSGSALVVIPILLTIAAILVLGGIIWHKRRNGKALQMKSLEAKRGQRQSDYEFPIDMRQQKETPVQYESVIHSNESSYYNARFKTDLNGPNTGYGEDPELNNYSEAYDHVKEKLRPTCIEVSEFQNFMTIDEKNHFDLLTKEFMMLQRGNQQPHKRPYKAADFSLALESDHSRVKLGPTEHVADSNFFDANYIKDSKGKVKFIATQRPQGKSKVRDFWRMIWQNNIKTVVMLEDVSTDGTHICSRYWPEKVNTSDLYDDLTVLWKESLTFNTYTIRKMTIIKNNDNICRTVQQVHFHRWANSGVPEDTTDLISVVQKVKILQEAYSDPVLVHCRDGCGATGTYIAIYCLTDVIKESKTICVYDFVKTMRKDRPGMVQTKMQYLFVYKTLREAQLIPNGSRISLDQLKASDDPSLKEKARKEYDMLRKMKQTLKAQDNNDGRAKGNVHKNRFKDIVPVDHFRPVLISKGYWSNSNDYINATLFENYGSRRIVMTQSPMKNTLEDFWRLVYDYECSTIVMLDDPTDKTFAQYWPDAREITFGTMTITCQDKAVAKTPNMRQFSLSQKKKKNSISVQQFVFNTRPKLGQQPDVTKLAEFVALTWNKLSNKTLIHCKNGVGLCAVYAIVISQIESLNLEGACDVFLSAHSLRKKNQHILQSQDEYTLCFQLLRDYYINEADYSEVY